MAVTQNYKLGKTHFCKEFMCQPHHRNNCNSSNIFARFRRGIISSHSRSCHIVAANTNLETFLDTIYTDKFQCLILKHPLMLIYNLINDESAIILTINSPCICAQKLWKKHYVLVTLKNHGDIKNCLDFPPDSE